MTRLATLSSIFRSRAALELENLARRHQIGVLQRSARKRPTLTSWDRLLWICLSRLWRDWRSALAIVKPETVVAWHRAGFRLFWTWKVRRGQPGRPVISRQVRDLIRKMCRENSGWGAEVNPPAETDCNDTRAIGLSGSFLAQPLFSSPEKNSRAALCDCVVVSQCWICCSNSSGEQ